MMEIDNILQKTLKEINNIYWSKNEMWTLLINQISENLTESSLSAGGDLDQESYSNTNNNKI